MVAMHMRASHVIRTEVSTIACAALLINIEALASYRYHMNMASGGTIKYDDEPDMVLQLLIHCDRPSLMILIIGLH
jgi:hypothetical protein